MSLKLPPIDKEKADRGFAFAFKSFFASFALFVLFLVLIKFRPESRFDLFCMVFLFSFGLLMLCSLGSMLVIKLQVKCYDGLDKLEQKTNSEPDIEKNE